MMRMNPSSAYKMLVKASFRTLKSPYVTEANTGEVKKTIIGNWIQYWKNVIRDYKSVILDVVSEIKVHPGKSSLKILCLGSLGYCAYENPAEENYFNTLIENQLRLVTVPSLIRNRNSEVYIQKLENYCSLNCLRYQSYGIFSIVYSEDYSEHLEVYKKQCNYFHPSYVEYLRERIIDVGFLNHWYFLNKAMEDHDVNPGEWEDNVVDLRS